jgi:hypothetical protein
LTKEKRITAIVLFTIVIIIVCFQYIKPLYEVSRFTRNSDRNPAQHTVVSSGQLVVGKDIHNGYYDIETKADTAVFDEIKIQKGEILHAIPLQENEKHMINGELTFSPADFSKLESKKGTMRISHSGYYEVGSEIMEGNYHFVLPDRNSPVDIFIDIKDKKGSVTTLQWDQATGEKSNNIKLLKGYKVYINIKDEQDNSNTELLVINTGSE